MKELEVINALLDAGYSYGYEHIRLASVGQSKAKKENLEEMKQLIEQPVISDYYYYVTRRLLQTSATLSDIKVVMDKRSEFVCGDFECMELLLSVRPLLP